MEEINLKLNRQQVGLIQDLLLELLEDSDVSKTTKKVADQIINKINEEL